MEILKDRYSITELSQRLNVTDHTLRYYQKEFNINVPKDDRGRRYYTPELANLMYQIKNMRNQGLEIKAIRNILQSENLIGDPPPVVLDESSTSIVPAKTGDNTKEMKEFFAEFKEQLTASVSAEVCSAREHLSKEISKSKLELGACIENSVRKLETKMEKHFQEVDKSLGLWREKNRRSPLKKIINKVFK